MRYLLVLLRSFGCLVNDAASYTGLWALILQYGTSVRFAYGKPAGLEMMEHVAVTLCTYVMVCLTFENFHYHTGTCDTHRALHMHACGV